MRLFNRRKEMEFDDPRLVGMSPLKPTEEIIGGQAPQLNKSSRTMPTLTEERPTTEVSTWKRVARPWDSLRRSESSDQLSKSVISHRRKTLHFHPNSEENIKFEDQEEHVARIAMSERIDPLRQQQHDTMSLSPKRKIGRVESLRLLLSKSNRIYRGRFVNSKQDKGTMTTQDLNCDLNDNKFQFPTLYTENDEIFHSKYSSISSLKSDTIFSPLSAMNQFRSRYQLPKATSCENLSIKNGNQGRTLPGYRDMSTSTTPFLDSSCFSPQQTFTTQTTNTKRSSFPHDYIIRSRLSSLQEEPKKCPIKPPRVSLIQKQDHTQNSCSFASNFVHKGFHHSMGNLLSSTKEEGHHSSAVDCEDEVESVCRIFSDHIDDPLKQIRIDLLHRNPSEIDEQIPSPTFWGRRSYSIGDMLADKRKVGKSNSGNSNGVEESGYDSDSTRNGHESPRNSVKSPASSETEADNIDPIKEECSTINKKSETTSLDSQTGSTNDSDTSSGGSSSCSFPASGGCLITINTINRNPKFRSSSVNGFRKGEDGSIIEVTSEIDQSEDVDFYSHATDGALEQVKERKTTDSIAQMEPADHVTIGYQESSGSSVFVSDGGTEEEKSKSRTKVEESGEKFTTTLPIKKPMLNDVQKVSSAPSLRLRNRVRDKDREWNSIKPSRSKSLCLSIFTVSFNKGPRKKSLGFSIIGGSDSPVPGIFIKRIFPYGQASEEGSITEGDEILSINGHPLANSTHAEALLLFKSIKTGDILLEVARREFLASNTSQTTLKRQYSQLSSKSCEQLHKAY
ncbi:PDZ domain-containing protein 2 [Folsomia candida]|uniref:PDZ domain-containing protein 2 n=1 Tax=Folsomia candida TaxID=158441 RepID=A0A226F3L1_FOLCA|nr:PDZ domain-containing protein 2 [Folsomia candida]